MSKTELSPDEIQTTRKELLDKTEKTVRQISQKSHEKTGGSFVGYVQDLYDVYHVIKNFDVPAHVVEEYQKDITRVVYNSGTLHLVSDVVKSLLSTGNYFTQAEKDTMATSVSHMLTFVNALMSYSCFSDELKEDLTNDSSFLPVLLRTLEAGHRKHMDKELSETQDKLLVSCLKLLHNCAFIQKTVARVRDVGAVKVLLPYLDSHNGNIQLVSVATLAKLVNEKEAENLLTNHVTIFSLLIKRLGKAWQSSTHREEWGSSVIVLSRTLRELARNDANKKVVVDKGGLPLLVDILNSPYNEEVEDSLNTLWVLSFDDVNKQKMVHEPKLVKRVWGKYSDDLSSDKIKKSSYGILWSLTDQLKMGELEFIGIACTIEDQKTKADMNPTERNRGATQTKSSDGFSYKGHLMLSYQWGHKDTIRKISQELKNSGVPVWIDVDFMEGSTLETMAKAVEDCSIFVMAVSKGYKESSNTRLEAGYAQRLNKPIIPLMMERGYKPDGWLGILMESKLFYDFSGKYMFDDKMSELLKEIKSTTGQDTSTGNEKTPGPLNGQQDNQQTDKATKEKTRQVNVTIICSVL